MAISFVQKVTGTWTSGLSFSSPSITLTAGNTVVVGIFIVSGGIGNEFSSFAGDGGTNTYTQIDALTSTGQGGTVGVDALTYYAKITTGGTFTLTVNTIDAGIQFATISVLEYSGADTTSPLDQHATFNKQTNIGVGTDAITSSSITTTANGDMLVGFMFSSRGGAGINYAAGTNYTLRETYAGTIGIGEDQIESTAGTIHFATATQDYSDAFTDNFSAIVTLKAAAGGVFTPYYYRQHIATQRG